MDEKVKKNNKEQWMSIKRIITITLACAAFATGAFGQTAAYPWHKSIKYPYGHMPKDATPAPFDHTKAKSWYDSWKTEHLKTCSDGRKYPAADRGSDSKVEGIGWAMIATAYMGDKADFDAMYRFYNSHTDPFAGGMMSWYVDCNGFLDNNQDNRGSAVDGDLDVAFALIVASWQWPNENYLEEAQKVLVNCKKVLNDCNGVASIGGGFSGGAWGGACDSRTNMSYYTPAFFKIFAEASGDQIWSKLAEDAYEHLKRGAHPTTGLVPGWQITETGKPEPGTGQNGALDSLYHSDASRTAWRLSLDYLWNGEERAKAWATKITDWAISKGGTSLNNMSEGFAVNGSNNPNGGSANFIYFGSWAVAAMLNDNVTNRNAFWDKIKNDNSNHWFPRTTGLMYWLTLTGNMWTEEQITGEAGIPLFVNVTGGGTIKRTPNKIRYTNGEKVKLTVVDDDNWIFEGWSGDASGKDKEVEITVSASTNVTANFSLNDDVNFVVDGNFTKPVGETWTLAQWGNSQGSVSTSNGVATITIIRNPETSNTHDLQLVQSSLPLQKGNTYVVSFDAWAAQPRTIELTIQKDVSPWTGYFGVNDKGEAISGPGPIELTTERKTFEYEFRMLENDDLSSRIGFNVGHSQSTASVMIANVSVKFKKDNTPVREKINPQSIKQTRSLRVSAKKSAVNVKFKAKASGVTELRLYGLRGEIVARVSINTVAGKSYTHTFNAAKLPNGVYVVSVQGNGTAERSKVIMPK